LKPCKRQVGGFGIRLTELADAGVTGLYGARLDRQELNLPPQLLRHDGWALSPQTDTKDWRRVLIALKFDQIPGLIFGGRSFQRGVALHRTTRRCVAGDVVGRQLGHLRETTHDIVSLVRQSEIPRS